LNKVSIYILLFFTALIVPQKKAIAQKIDTIYHINGNILTGDFKNLTYGVVLWKMDGMGTISLEEVKINTIISQKKFEIKMKNDLIYFGSFAASKTKRTVFIVTADKKELVNIEDIVEVYPIKGNFWKRVSGDFSLGFNYSKGSDIATVVFSGNLDYRKKISYFNLSWNDNNTYQGDTLNASKTNVGIAWQRLLKKGWSAEIGVSGNQNTELGTKIRWELDLMGIKDISYNSWNRLYVGSGLSITSETNYNDPLAKNDLAGIFQAVWKVYKYTNPKVWVDANMSYIPYLTDGGRYRTSFNLNPKVSVFSDNLKIGFTFYYNYDSEPPSEAYSTNDYGINLQLSYSFH